MVWSEETILLLRQLWTQGHSTAEIGRRLGVTKNAIVGKAHRLDLTARPSPIRRDKTQTSGDRPPTPVRMGGPTLPPLASSITHSATPYPGSPYPGSSQQAATQPAAGNVQAIRPTPAATATAQGAPANPAPRPFPAPRSAAPPVRAISASPPMPPRRSAPSCCWPIGEPGKRDFRFCDDPSMAGKPYCEDHAKLAYVKIRDRREDAA